MVLAPSENRNTTRKSNSCSVLHANDVFLRILVFVLNKPHFTFARFVLEHAIYKSHSDTLYARLLLATTFGGVAFSHLILILTR